MHLYIHIPFCESKCYYCSFTSLKLKDYENAYLSALKKDLKEQISNFKLDKNSLKSVFIGGGTPSMLKINFYEEIFEIFHPLLASNAEISIEANPNSASLEWQKGVKDLGVNRISFGAQSFNEKKLQFLGRIHDQKMIFQALENAQKSGIKNVNLDLIYDTKMDDKKMLENELLNLKSISNLITHLSAYNLTIEPQTRFAKKEHFKKNAPRLMKFFIQSIENLGFIQYEISNFAKHLKTCKHNLAYWQGKNYLGCGLCAVGFYKNRRFYTAKNLKSYLENPSFREIEILSQEDLNLEHIFLGLRSIVGVDIAKLNEKQKAKASLLVNEKKLSFKKGKFYNPNFLLSDEIALYLS